MPTFKPNAYQYVTFEPRFDVNGKVWLNVQAHDALVAKTPYQIIANEYGLITKAVTDEEYYCRMGVPEAAVDSGAYAWIQHGGYVANMICSSDTFGVGHAVKKYDATIVCTDADYTGGASEFAVAAETVAEAAEIVDVMLMPRQILGTT